MTAGRVSGARDRPVTLLRPPRCALITLVILFAPLALAAAFLWRLPRDASLGWAVALAITVIPALWAAILGLDLAPRCSSADCLAPSDRDQLLVAVGAVVLLVGAVVATFQGRTVAMRASVIGAQLITAYASARWASPARG